MSVCTSNILTPELGSMVGFGGALLIVLVVFYFIEKWR